MKDQRLLPALMLAIVTVKLILALLFPPFVAGLSLYAGYIMMPAVPVAASIMVIMGILVLLRYGSMFLRKP